MGAPIFLPSRALFYQPNGPRPINRANSLGARVIEAFPLTGTSGSNGTAVTLGAGGTLKAGPTGISLRGTGAAVRANAPLNLSTKSKITIAFWLYLDAYAFDDGLAMEYTANTNSTAGGFYIDPNAPSGVFVIAVNGSGASGSGYTFPRPSAAAWHRYAISINVINQSVTAWVDGAIQTMTAFGAFTTGTTFGSSTLNFLNRAAANLPCTGNLQDVTVYDGLFDSTSALADYQNPYQIYLPQRRAPLYLAAGGATDTPINPGAGTLSITGYAPTITQTTTLNLAPGVAALSITGYAPSVTQGNTTNIAPGVAALTLTGYAPSIAQSANQSIAPNAAALTITGFAPVVAQTDNHAVNPGAAALVITGYAPTITQQTASPNLMPGAAALSITGFAPTISQAPAIGAPRYARPVTDVAAGTWLPSVPGASLASMVDEPSADSSDYIYSTSPGSCEIALAPVQNPHSITGQVFRYQMWSPFGNGVTVRLMCGAAVVAEWVHDSLPTVPTIFPRVLSAGQIASIANYNDLRLVAVAG